MPHESTFTCGRCLLLRQFLGASCVPQPLYGLSPDHSMLQISVHTSTTLFACVVFFMCKERGSTGTLTTRTTAVLGVRPLFQVFNGDNCYGLSCVSRRSSLPSLVPFGFRRTADAQQWTIRIGAIRVCFNTASHWTRLPSPETMTQPDCLALPTSSKQGSQRTRANVKHVSFFSVFKT